MFEWGRIHLGHGWHDGEYQTESLWNIGGELLPKIWVIVGRQFSLFMNYNIVNASLQYYTVITFIYLLSLCICAANIIDKDMCDTKSNQKN